MNNLIAYILYEREEMNIVFFSGCINRFDWVIPADPVYARPKPEITVPRDYVLEHQKKMPEIIHEEEKHIDWKSWELEPHWVVKP